MITRRRFLTITAGLGLSATLVRGAFAAPELSVWRGTAMGAGATIALTHPDAQSLTAMARAEITRLEGVFSLFRANSELARLNGTGRLDAPAPELLDCLSLAGRVHDATEGRFDPTVQPLWSLWAGAIAKGETPDAAALARARALTGWDKLRLSESEIVLAPGTQLTLNGIAQGYIADRVAMLLRRNGVDNVLIDTGEVNAQGSAPEGGDWPVTLTNGQRLGLRNRALASSAPLGTVLDPAGRVGHIFDPRTGVPAAARWSLVSVSAPHAGLADALSTAGCLFPDRATFTAATAEFNGVRIEAMA